MKLWTWHKRDFSLIAGHVDHGKSEYVQTVVGIARAYAELATRVGTDQIIWCHTVPNQRSIPPSSPEVEWILEVPLWAVLRFVDDLVWNRLLGIRCALPNHLRFAWRNEAIRRFPYDIDGRHRFEDEKRDDFWNRPPPGGSWWDSLFVAPQADEFVSALIRHPVEAEWVLKYPVEARNGDAANIGTGMGRRRGAGGA